MEKRGQFYLVAALVIIAVVASLATIHNSVKVSEEDASLYDLSDEINFEVLQFLDSGFFNGLSDEQINSTLTNLLEYYSLSNPDTDLIIIYGNTEKVNVLAYIVQTTGSICFGNSCEEDIQVPQLIYKELSSGDISDSRGKITIILDDIPYTFDVKEEGQNFFLVLKREGDGEIFSTTSGQECSINSDCRRGRCVDGECIQESAPQCGLEGEVCCSAGDPCKTENLVCYNEENVCRRKCQSNHPEDCRDILGLAEGDYTCENGICVQQN